MRRAALMMVLVLAATGLGGCDQSAIGFFVQETGALFSAPAKTKPALSLEGKDVLLVVDAARRELTTEHPRLGLLTAAALVHELNAKAAARHITDPNELAVFARNRPKDYSQLSLVELGRQFKDDLVIHVVIEDYRLETNPGTDNFAALVAVSLRVIDVAKGDQIFPELGGEDDLDVRSEAGIAASSPQAAEKVLLDGLALKIAQLFVAYEVDKLPLHPEVK